MPTTSEHLRWGLCGTAATNLISSSALPVVKDFMMLYCTVPWTLRQYVLIQNNMYSAKKYIKIIKPCNNNCNCMQWLQLRKSPEGYRIQEGDLVVKVNGVAADGPLAHHMPAIAGKVMEVPGNGEWCRVVFFFFEASVDCGRKKRCLFFMLIFWFHTFFLQVHFSDCAEISCLFCCDVSRMIWSKTSREIWLRGRR